MICPLCHEELEVINRKFTTIFLHCRKRCNYLEVRDTENSNNNKIYFENKWYSQDQFKKILNLKAFL